VFENWLRDQFVLFRLPVLRYTTSYLVQIFNDSRNSRYKIDELDLRNYLTIKGLKPSTESIYHKVPKGFEEREFIEGSGAAPLDEVSKIKWWGGTGRPYTFNAIEWLTKEELVKCGIAQEEEEGNKNDLPF